MKYKPIKIKGIKIIQPHFNLDSDRDGIPDWRDCRPFNPRLQHAGKVELPVDLGNIEQTYNRVISNAFKVYGGPERAKKFVTTVVKAKIRNKAYSPTGYSDLQARGIPVYSFVTSQLVHDRGNTLETYDEFHKVYSYTDITKQYDELSAFKLDNKYVRNPSAKKTKILLLVTALDREKLGKVGLSALIDYAYRNKIYL